MIGSPSSPRPASWSRLWLLPLILAVMLALPCRATADGDPASDYLLVAPVFYPYQPRTAPALRRALEGALGKLRAKGLNLKVAIIARPIDLGAVPDLFGRPQAYAAFLEPEISFNQTQPLLVVMPAGFGVSHAGAPDALKGQAVDARHGANGLSRSAILAVVELARVNGKPISVPGIPPPTTASKGGVSPLITFGAPAAFVLLTVLVVSLLRQRLAEPGESEPPPREPPP
jgi:hypothetical protein